MIHRIWRRRWTSAPVRVLDGAMHLYAIALGSNRRTRHGSPGRTLRAALAALAEAGIRIDAVSPLIATPAVGPAGRGFANAAAIISATLRPPEMLLQLKRIERSFGRRPGRRWGARPLDLDILLWSGGGWPARPRAVSSTALAVPHPGLASRRFVLDPLMQIAPEWTLPQGRIAVRHLHARLVRPRPLGG